MPPNTEPHPDDCRTPNCNRERMLFSTHCSECARLHRQNAELAEEATPQTKLAQTAVNRCPKCGLTLTHADRATLNTSGGLMAFCLAEGYCPLCVQNSLLEGQPRLETI